MLYPFELRALNDLQTPEYSGRYFGGSGYSERGPTPRRYHKDPDDGSSALLDAGFVIGTLPTCGHRLTIAIKLQSGILPRVSTFPDWRASRASCNLSTRQR